MTYIIYRVNSYSETVFWVGNGVWSMDPTKARGYTSHAIANRIAKRMGFAYASIFAI